MPLHTRVRQGHRWLSVAFVVSIAANLVTLAVDEPPAWVAYVGGLPLIGLLLSGIHLFALPYLARRRVRGRVS